MGDGLFLAGSFMDSKAPATAPLLIGGGLTYALSGSVVHLAHRQWAKAAASPLIYVGAPLLLGFAGAGIGLGLERAGVGPKSTIGIFGNGTNGALMYGAMIGFITGTAVAITLDVAALAYEPARPLPMTGHAPPLTLSLLPLVGPSHEGIGLVGQF